MAQNADKLRESLLWLNEQIDITVQRIFREGKLGS
jgi:hypothetical protein